jgi:Bacterial Ig-like domain
MNRSLTTLIPQTRPFALCTWLLGAALATILAACGGGGGGGDGGGGGGANGYTIGGTLTNYTGRDLMLQNDGGEGITIVSGATSFTFPARINGGTNYAVTIAGQPIGQDCTIANAAGTANANVSNVAVTCGPMAPLTVLSGSPADGATDVSRSVRPTLTFSAAVEADSTNRGLTGIIESVGGGGGGLNAVATVDGEHVTFTPALKLLPLSRHTTAVYKSDAGRETRGARGQALVATRTFEFTTGDGAWQPTKLADRGLSGDAEDPSIAMDASGNAIAVWSSRNGAVTSALYWNRYDAATASWGTPTPLAFDSSGPVTSHQVAMDAAGNAVAVWAQVNSASPPFAVVFASRYSKTTGQWSAREPVSHVDGSTARTPQVVVHSRTGAVTVTWIRKDVSLGDHVWTSRSGSALTGAWSGPDCVGPDLTCGENAPNISNLRIAAGNTDDVAIITWDAQPASLVQVWARRMVNGAFDGSGRVVSQGNVNGTSEHDSRALFDRAGIAYVVWTQELGGRSNISMRRQGPDGVWNDIEPITNPAAGNASLSVLASNGSIRDTAVDSVWLAWVQETSTQAQAWAWKVGSGDPWVARRPISAVSARSAIRNIEIAVDRAGNAHAAWMHDFNFASSRYGALNDAWSEPWITTDGVNDRIGLSVNNSGDALAWWLQAGSDATSPSRIALQTRRFE